MGRQPCCDKLGVKRGPWTSEEDKKLISFILTHGRCCWRAVPKLAGLLRCGKSCRLRWTNYLRPDLKRGLLTAAEEQIVIDLHAKLGNRWSKIAAKLPGRTDNEIKNHWNTHLKKKLIKMGIDPATHQLLDNTKVTTTQSTATLESAESRNTGHVQSLKECSQETLKECSQETVPIPTDSSEQFSWLEQSNNACSHGMDPVMDWQSEVDLPIDEPWINFTSSNSDELGIVADPLPSDGAMDWLLDYQDFGIYSSNLVGDSTVHSSNGSNF